MNPLLREKFTIEIEIGRFFKKSKLFSKKYIVEYEQATYREVLWMAQECQDFGTHLDWIFYFLNKRSGIKRKHFEELTMERAVEIFEFIIRTFAKDFIDLEQDKSEIKVKEPDSAGVCAILKNTNETMESFLNLTYSQIKFLIEGLNWNMNAITKEGKRKNSLYMSMKGVRGTDSIKDARKSVERFMERKQKVRNRNEIKKIFNTVK